MTFSVNKRLILAWFLNIPICYLVVGFLDIFYRTAYEILLITVLVQIIFQKTNTSLVIIVFLLLNSFLVYLTKTANRFPTLFKSSVYEISPDLLVWFFIAVLISLPALFWILDLLRSRKIHQTRFFSFI